VKRREFITLLSGAAAAWPLAGRAQQPAMPVIGFLGTISEAQSHGQVTAFRRGLSQVGFDEGRNVAFEFRWAEGRYERLPAMAAELARRPVALILANAPPAALTAKGRPRRSRLCSWSDSIRWRPGSPPASVGRAETLLA
jgi:putative tryptophan/tyrosine transport system substrate-binding protein